MGDLLLQGLWISLTGLLLTFAALAGLILVIVALNRLFAPRQRPPQATAGPAPVPAGTPDTGSDRPDEVAAAIAVALAHWRRAERGAAGLGQALAAGPGRWWQPASDQRPRR